MDRSTLATMCRYIAMIFAVLVMSIANIGTAWGYEKLFINQSTGALYDQFVFANDNPSASSDAKTIDGNSYTYYVSLSNKTETPVGISDNKVIRYDVKTNNVKVEVFAYNIHEKTDYKVYVSLATEGNATPSISYETVEKNSGLHYTKTYNSSAITTNASIYIHVEHNSNVRIYQVKITESGTRLPLPGEGDYSCSFNKGRLAIQSGKTKNIDSLLTISGPGSGYSALSSSYLTLASGGNYLQFTARENCEVTIVRNNSAAYYFGTSASPTTTEVSSAAENNTKTFELTSGTTYKVSTKSSGLQLTSLYFESSSCTDPGVATSLTSTAATGTSLTLSWTAGSNASSYKVSLYTDAECTEAATSTQGNDYAVNTNSATFTGLSLNTTYYYKVQSVGNGTTYCADGPWSSVSSGISTGSCNDYSFHYGTENADDWTTACFTQVEGAEWEVASFTIPNKPNWYVGKYGFFYSDGLNNENAKSHTDGLGDLFFAASQGNGSGTRPKVGSATGATGRIRIYNNSSWNNLFASFEPDGYKLKFGSSTYGAFEADGSVDNCYWSPLMTYNSTTAGDLVSVGVINGSGDYVATNNTEGMKHIFLHVGNTSTLWGKDSWSNFGLYDYTHTQFTCLMTKVPGETCLYEGWVPSTCTQVIFVRLKSSTPAWGDNNSNITDQTGCWTIPANTNMFTISSFSSGSWSAYEKSGQFRMWDNSTEKNWYVHFYPHNVLSYDGNGGSGSMTPQSVKVDAADQELTVAGNGFTREGWTFTGWNTEKHGGGTAYAAGDDIDVTEDIKLYAQWERTVYLKSDLSWWYNDGAWFAVYYFDSEAPSNNGWAKMSLADCESDVYTVEIPGGGYNSIIFVRMKAADKSTLAFSNSDNQTVDISVSSLSTNSKYTITSTSDSKCTGTWGTYSVPTFTISYDGGDDSEEGEKDDETKTCNVAFTLPSSAVFTRTGYTQTGWTTSDGEAQTHALGGSYTTNDDQTFYPVWTVNNYTLTWNLAGGKVTTAGTGAAVNATGTPNSEVAFGTAITAPTVTKTGYTFAGWSSDVASTMPATNTTYTATWTVKTTTITINANSGNHGSTAPSPITATYGSALPSFTAATGASGWNLTGYFTAETSGTKVINANGTLVANTDYADGSGNWKYETASLTLYAQYEAAAPAPVGDCGEIIKSTFSGTKNSAVSTTTFNTTGEIGGTSTSYQIGEQGKLNTDGAYLILKLSTGTFLAGDTIKISSDKSGVVKFATGTVSTQTYTLIGTASTATSGGQPYYFVLAANADSIIVPRTSSDYNQNPKIAYVSVCRPCPECDAAPSAPTATSNGATAATTQVVSWTDGSNDKWDVYVSTSSSTPAAGVTPTASGLTAKTYTFTGLTASTTYYWWVRSVCDDTHKSSWFAGSSFTTSAATYTLTTTVGTSGAATGGATITNGVVASIPAGTTVTNNGDNTFTVNTASPTTVTATASVAGVAGLEDDTCTYAFISWENLPATVTADVSNIHALYEARFTIGFKETDGNAVAGISSTYYVYGTGKAVSTFPTPTKSGYTFAGWYKDDALNSTATDLANDDYGAIDYYAKWTAAPAGTTYYLVTSTAQLNTTDTYVIMDDGKAAMMGVADGSNTYLNAITSGFTAAADKSTVTVSSSDVNTLTLQEESSAWNIVGKNNKKLSTKGTVDGKLYANTDKATTSGTDDFVFSFADGKAIINRPSSSYHIYYTSGTGFNQSESTTNIRLYTSNSTPVYTVTYDLNGGTGTVPTNRPEKSGTSITLASSAGLTKDGFTFDGWLCSVNSTKYAAGASYTMTAANTTFTAQWEEAVAPTLYTVTFNSNGGSSVEAITQASEGASITMPTAPTYTGHTFQGWVIGGTTKAAGASYTPAANVTAYATWKANCAGGGSGSTEVYNGENVAKGNTTASGWTINNSSDMTLTSGSSNGYSYWYQAGSSTSYVQFDGSASLVAGDQIKIQWTHTNGSDKNLALTINGSSASLTSGGTTKNSVKVEAVYDVTSAQTVTSIKLKSSGSSGCIIYQVTIVKASGGGCCYVTYNGNGAESGCISDKTAYTAGEGDVTILGNTGVSAYVKLGYRFNGWNTAANGSGMAYAAGDVVENISNDLTLHAQWVLDACSAPAAPTISGTASRTEGQTISLTASCASGADGSTTYTWYKGETFGDAEQVQAAMTAGAGGRTYSKASCVAGDADKYWCEASNGTGCDAHNETGFTVTVSAAVAEHIYYYKDANHYSDGTYSNPEGNTAASGDNKSLSSPWMICNGCKAGVDSVVAHGATYDGKGNWVNAYIKLPSGGDASTKNIKFALAAGYTGTLTIKMGKYKGSSTLPTASLKLNGAGEDISPTDGGPDGVATTEDNFSTTTWNLSTAGGTYILTVSSANAYISQIDMTTATTATFNVTYNGNGSTGGSVPTDATNYDADASVTVQAQGTMEKANYTFGGWNTANNGTGTNYVAGSGTFSIKGATTLYAHWTQSINLAPGAKGTGSLGATVSWNGTAVRGFTAHTAAGYSLTGYYTDPSGGTKVLNSDGSFAGSNIDGYITDGKWSRTGAVATLYAQWSGSAIVTNTLNVGSKTWGSSITTTAPLQITNLIALAGQGGINVGEATDDQAAAGTPGSGKGKGSLSPKVEANSGESKNAGEYMELSFTVATGYQLRVTGLSAIVRSVSNDGKYDAILSDGTNSIEVTGVTVAESLSSGANLFTSSYNTTFEGDVTLKIWGYSKSSGKAMTTYRYATPIAIYGAVEESCTPPTFSGLDYSATEYTQGAAASAISVTGAANVESCQWKYNTVNDRTSGTECGTGASVTPATDASATTDGTRYYWCELTNGCTTVKTSTVAVTVSASASNPTVTWSDVKLNGEATTVNYGGGKYELRATVNETGWSGTLASSMVTAPAGIYIHNIGTGTEDSKKYIEFQFDVTTAFDREANETIGFHLSLPAISGWNALTSDKQVAYEACDEGAGVGGMIYLPVKSTQTTAKSGMQYYWESTGSGRLASQYGGSAMGAANNSSGYKTADSTFYYYAASTGDKWMFQTYVGGVNKVRVVFHAAGALKSSNLTISKFCYDTEYFSSQGDRQVSIGEVSPSKASFASGEDGYMEFTVPEMAANSYAYFQTGSSNIKIYGIVLYSESSGSGGSVETDPTWSGGLNKDGSSEVEKAQGAANFTYTISTTTNTLGGITYSSSDPSVAEVNATTGEVRITATGESTQTAVITATLARSGCYQPATRTYTVRVAGNECTDPIGTIAAEDQGCSGMRLTFSGYAAGAAIQWYKNGNTIADDGGDANVYTATEAGSYYAVATLGCARQSNTIVLAAAEVDADRVVEKWYIKNGRLTPDIKLWTLDEGSHLVSVAWSPSNATGLNLAGDIYESDGAVYLTGRAPNSNTGADIEYTLTLTINNGCGGGSTTLSNASKQIKIVHQKNTDKHVLAFVVTGKQNGGFTESIPASQTTSVDLYNEIAKNFDVLATNIYSTDDEQKIKEYYSQFDIICITDYPNTKTKGSHSVSYSNAIGVMVDIRPVLTMEAWVSGLSNWNKKGISGDPKSPSTRQYTMLLQCKDHEIFAGTTLTEIGEGDDKMYRITMVDKNVHPYDTLDANYGAGAHESKKGYRYGSYPALQGFTFSQAMEDADLLPLGLIDDGAGNDLQVGLERQHEMSARMMVLGINSTAMERLTDDGERIVINALKYLMKKNAEEIADCSTSFVGGAEGDETNWMNADNWTGNTVPDKTQKVRILAECVVPAGEKAHVAGVLIAPEGGTYNGGSAPTTGSLTIAAGGALVVDGKVESVTAPAYNRPRATTPADMTIQTSPSAQGALIFDNSEGETQATVVVRSKANKDGSTRNWQYLTSPLQETPVTEFFYGIGTYTYKHSEADGGWVRYNLGTTFHAFDAIGLTQEDAKDFVFYGPLAPTGEWNLSLTHAYSGNNLFGNSWTAPIDLKALVRNTDFDSNIELDLAIYNTGVDQKNGSGEFVQAANADNTPGTWHHIPLYLATLEDAGWEGMTVIPAYQAFQLKATATATLTIDYDKCVRGSESKNYTEPLRSPGHRAAGKSNSDIEALRLAVSDAKGIAYIYLLEGEQFSEEYDNGWELEYKPNSKYGKLYAISPEQGDMMALARPSLEGTMVGFQPGESSEYTITFNETDGYYYLNDLKMEQSTLIQAGESYTFSVEEGESANRFLISSVPFNKPGIVTGVTNLDADAPKVQKVIYNDKLYIIRGGKVFSADGQLVK